MVETIYRLPGAPRLALLGDFHNGDPAPILASLARHKPELICIAGDLVYGLMPKSGHALEEQRNVLPLLEGCADTAPTFLSLGNHEYILSDWDLQRIQDTGAVLLDNCWRLWQDIHIGGVTSHEVLDVRAIHAANPDWHGGLPKGWVAKRTPELDWLRDSPAGYKLLLCHHPEYYPLLPGDVHLVLSAHAHGGQIQVFRHGVYAPGQGLWPRYTSGVHDGRFVITRGLTNTVRVPRLGNPTEIVYLEW